MTDGWFDTVTDGVPVRTVQKMQNEAGLQLGMLPILKARGKSCMKRSEERRVGKEC